MTFPTPNGTTNLGDPITDTGERRRKEDVKASDKLVRYCVGAFDDAVYLAPKVDPLLADRERLQTANFILRQDLLSAHIELRRLSQLLNAYRQTIEAERKDANAMAVVVARIELFAELDIQNGDAK